ncbi:hypothetical protein OROGR_001242 [Orobanche gracilis]
MMQGVSKYHFGSEVVATSQVRVLDKGEEKILFDFFKRAKLNATGAYVNNKSVLIAVAMESRIVDEDHNVEVINKIFFQVNPPDDKASYMAWRAWTLHFVLQLLRIPRDPAHACQMRD